MSRQLSLDNYFSKSKASTSKSSQSSELRKSDVADKKCKRRNLSLRKQCTPSKCPKVSLNNRNIVVNLCSDEDDALSLSTTCVNLSQSSNVSEEFLSATSDMTVAYSLTQESPRTTQSSSTTPQKSRSHVATLSQSFRSPQSREKYFSPVKNRSVVKKKTPVIKVKRSLTMGMSNGSSECVEHTLFNAACEDMDHMTIFLLTIINKFLNDASLGHLLDLDARALLNRCLEVVKPGMKLVCRLYWRKEGWYRREQVRQISCDKEPLDDPRLEVMIQSLVESGLVTEGNHTMGFEEFKTILKKDELVQTCKELKLKVASKQDAIEALGRFSRRASNISTFFIGYKSSNAGRVLKIMRARAGACYKLSDCARTTLHKLHILMYLGMDYSIIREKKLELTLLNDKIQRETFPVDKQMVLDNASIVFKNADEFERYLTAHKINEDFLNETDCSKKCNMVKQVNSLYKEIGQNEMMGYKSLPAWLQRYTPAHIYVKILEAGVQYLKKDKDGGHYLLALDILTALIAQNEFRLHKKAEWYAEKALILHSLLYRCDEAAEVLLQGFKSNLSEEAKDSMRPRALKIANQKSALVSEHLKQALIEHATKENILEKNLGGEHIYKQPMERTSKRGKVKFESRTVMGREVVDAEEYCIAHYISNNGYTDGEHWEGSIVTTIFFLLFWDIVYTKPAAAGVFLSHYQQFPLDLYSASFYENRRAAVDERLADIEGSAEDQLLRTMHDTWRSRPDTELSGIHRKLGWDKVRAVSACLGPRALAAVCRRLATNYSYAHSGFPDLTLWNEDTKKIKFVEVKTDSDKPSMKQIQWMNYLREHGIDTEFCYLGVNTTRQRCRTGRTPLTTVKKERRKRIKTEKKVKIEVTASQDTVNNAAKIKVTSPHIRVNKPTDAEQMEVTSSPQARVKVEPQDVEELEIISLKMELKDSVKSEVASSQSPVKEPKDAEKAEVIFQARVKAEPNDTEMEVISTEEDSSKKEPSDVVKNDVTSSQEIVKKELLDEAISPKASQCSTEEDSSKKESSDVVKNDVTSSQEIVKKELLDEAISPKA